MHKLVVIILLVFSCQAFSCDLSDEYESIRVEARNELLEDYKRCISSVSEARYWYSYVQCLEAGDGENVGGGCAHIAGRGGNYKKPDINSDFCETLKPVTEEYVEHTAYLVKERGISKCK
ncbi:hypothetical protein K5Y46_001867 [Vibrio fluvialis]|nr:hypothetical protein [Vibrio fluvialis]